VWAQHLREELKGRLSVRSGASPRRNVGFHQLLKLTHKENKRKTLTLMLEIPGQLAIGPDHPKYIVPHTS